MSLNTSSADISLLPPPAALANVEKKLKSTRWLIAIAGTVLVILAGLGGGLLYHFLSSASKSTVPSAGSESSSTSDTHSPSTANQYQVLGCFHDENAHALTISAGTGFNVQTCYEYASLHQYGYFGLENGGDCYVGNGNYAVYGDANVCQSTCSDGSAGPCGGQWLLSVYSLNAVTVQCAGNEFATPAAGTGGRHLICLPCGANSSSQGGQSTACSCNSGYSNWVVGVGCSV